MARLLSLLLAAATAGAGAGCKDVYLDPFHRLDGGGGAGGGGAGGGGTGGTIIGPCSAEQLGYATIMGGTRGGAAGQRVTATTLEQLIDYAGRTDPLVIEVRGMLQVDPLMQPFQVVVTSNKTIVGGDAQSGLVGGGFVANDRDNVIFQNLVIAKAVDADAIGIQHSRHVWVDHCDLSSDRDHDTGYYDGLIDITHASDFVTVSWTRFHDHFNISLVGHSDMPTTNEDIGHLTVTYHHNLFEKTASGMPRVRYGSVHVFNNHYATVSDFAIASQMGAQVLVENNVFETVKAPLTNTHGLQPGAFDEHNASNLYLDSANSATELMPNPFPFTFVPPYDVDKIIDSTASVRALVAACAGTGKI